MQIANKVPLSRLADEKKRIITLVIQKIIMKTAERARHIVEYTHCERK